YTYAHLGQIARVHPVPRAQQLSGRDFRLETPHRDAPPAAAASAGENSARAPRAGRPAGSKGPTNTEGLRSTLFALPERSGGAGSQSLRDQLNRLLGEKLPGYETFRSAFADSLRFDRKTMELRRLKRGSMVTGGTVLGRVGRSDSEPPHLNFAIRPAGRGAPSIDPKPILDGWKLL